MSQSGEMQPAAVNPILPVAEMSGEAKAQQRAGTKSFTAPAAGSCISDWSEAGPIVRREGLATMERVGRLARDRASLEIVTSALCMGESGYVYRLRVRGGHGGGKASLKTLYVDARQPFGP